MMHPNDRRHLLDALRPPDGCTFDAAIGTTYSLDLTALLTVPLSFGTRNIERRDGEPLRDPLALLQALRATTGRIDLFCDAGRTGVPPQHNRLLTSFLEQSVHMVHLPAGGAFHPKVWILRYTDEDGTPRYRCLVLSRNLTFDRSWDLIVCLEGQPVPGRVNAFAVNHPLADFIRGLPALALHALPPDRTARIEQIADELRITRFDPPDGFSELRFHAIAPGMRTRPPLLDEAARRTILSPFLSEDLLERCFDGTKAAWLVSRGPSLDALPAELLDRFTEVYVLDAALESELQDGGDDTAEDVSQLFGMHAKMYILETGRVARVFAGSANATTAAFRRNVEFLVELVGSSARYGAAALFAEGARGEPQFRDLLRPYLRPGPPIPPDPAEEALEEARRAVLDALVRADLAFTCGAAASDQHTLTLTARASGLPPFPPEAEVRCHPASLTHMDARVIDSGALPVTFGPVSFAALTSFLVVEVRVTVEGGSARSSFVLNLPLDDAPADRHGRVVVELVRDPEQFLRLLLLILGHADPVQLATHARAADAAAAAWLPGGATGVLEHLVRAVCTHPERIDDIDRIVREFERHARGGTVLPEGFMNIWEPIRAARREYTP